MLFRSYHTERIIKGTVTVKALHISFDLKDDLVLLVQLENATCQDALNRIFANTQFCQHYVGYSNIENPQRFTVKDKSPSEAIVGSTGSIIDTYGLGAEIKRDNTNIYVFDHRGTNKGVTIEYGVNMLEENLQVDMTDLVTVIYPYARYYTEDMQEVEVRANPVYSPLHESYDHDRIRFRDYSLYYTDGTIPTIESLRAFAQQEFDVNQVDRPKCSYTLVYLCLVSCVKLEIADSCVCDGVNLGSLIKRSGCVPAEEIVVLLHGYGKSSSGSGNVRARIKSDYYVSVLVCDRVLYTGLEGRLIIGLIAGFITGLVSKLLPLSVNYNVTAKTADLCHGSSIVCICIPAEELITLLIGICKLNGEL